MSNIHKENPPRKPFSNPRKYRDPRYDTTRWRAERIQFIRENPECVLCLEEGRYGQPSTVVDHINPISKYPEHMREQMFWDRNNWQAICSTHHNSKSGTERR